MSDKNKIKHFKSEDTRQDEDVKLLSHWKKEEEEREQQPTNTFSHFKDENVDQDASLFSHWKDDN